MINLEQYDYNKGIFQDDCFKINAIPLRSNNLITKSPQRNDLSQMKKFPDDLIYAYLCEVCFLISSNYHLNFCFYLDNSISSYIIR